MKTFQDIIVAKKLDTLAKIKKYLIGKKIRIIGGDEGNNYPQGIILTIDNFRSAGGITTGNCSINSITYKLKNNYNTGNTIYAKNFIVVGGNTIAEIKEEIRSLKEEKKEIDKNIEECNFKLDYMKENNLKEYDEDQFKVFSTLQLLKNPKLDDIEKSKIIAKLIKS